VAEPSNEHQLNRLIFDGVSKYMDTLDLPAEARGDRVTPIPYLGELGDVTVAFISLFRRTRANGGVGLIIQYTVRIGETVVASLVRNSRDPIYGMFHFRREHLPKDLEHLKATLIAPMSFREMTRAEAETFAVEDKSMAKKQIRVIPR
tara:strand:- start:280 stop:723 length:444 start_codon:yes stop_codon:yes gene_type:complete